MMGQAIFIPLMVIGVLLTVIGSRVAGGNPSIQSNTQGRAGLGAVLLVGWVASLAVALSLVPSREYLWLAIVGFIWLILAAGAWAWYTGTVRAEYLRPGTLGYFPTLIRYWPCVITAPNPMKTDNTYLVEVGFEERSFDVKARYDIDTDTEEGKSRLEALLQRTMTIELPGLSEQAMVESGNLLHNKDITVAVSAPAFSITTKEYNVNIEDLVHSPLKIPCVPEKTGDHQLVLDFYDCLHHRCGGITAPIKVRERSPLLGERAARVVQIVGGIITAVGGLFLIADKILSLIP